MIEKIAKPFLKWAGGKTQLITQIEKSLPYEITTKKFTYIEPFVGSGAVLFWMLNNFPKLEKAVINDINSDLINAYKVIQSKPKELISILQILQDEFHSLESKPEEKKEYYYQKRELYNTRKEELSGQAALFIFLNRTCFNGLYRVNKSNGYNVPMGSYKKPTICDDQNIMAVSNALQKVEILCGDYEVALIEATPNSFFYFDPPYKPLSDTSSFNSYAKDEFNDEEQIRLRNFCSKLDKLGYKWLLSNSDVKGNDTKNNFFDDLYSDFYIQRVDARRSINANPEKRGVLKELLISNKPKPDYIPVIKNNITMFTNFEEPFWTFKEKVSINEIRIDKKLMSFENRILNSTLNNIIYYFDEDFWLPITINKDYFLLDGQHRLEAAKRMNLKYIDVVIENRELLNKTKSKDKNKFEAIEL
jgi:DNA adenine methylase